MFLCLNGSTEETSKYIKSVTFNLIPTLGDFHFDLASHRPILLPRRPLRSYYVKYYVLHHVYQVVDGCYQFGARYTLKHILVAIISRKTDT